MIGRKETGCTDLALDVEDCDYELSARYITRETMNVPRLAMALVLPVRGTERAQRGSSVRLTVVAGVWQAQIASLTPFPTFIW